MNEQQIREEFRKLVIMGNHKGMSYDGAVNKEKSTIHYNLCKKCPMVGYENEEDFANHMYDLNVVKYDAYLLTLGRVLQALWKSTIKHNTKEIIIDGTGTFGYVYEDGSHRWIDCQDTQLRWQLTKEGKECDADDQSIETIKDLLTLLKK